jgi:hypothetical protein
VYLNEPSSVLPEFVFVYVIPLFSCEDYTSAQASLE